MSDVTTPHRQRQPNRTSPPRPYAHHTTHRGVHLLTSYVTQEQTARSGTNNAPPLTSRSTLSKAVIHVEEFPPPPLKLVPVKRHRGEPGHKLVPVYSRARFENMQPSRSAPSFSFASGSPRRPFRFTDVRLAKYQPLIERTQCMHHGNHGRPPR